MKKLLIINAGSSSMKFQVVDRATMEPTAEGIAERITVDGAFSMKFKGEKYDVESTLDNHDDAVKVMLEQFEKHGVIESMEEIIGIGHRVVQGGEVFKESSIITKDSVSQIEELSALAPLHNPGAAAVMKAFFKLAPHAKNVAVFDTSFHQTMPKKNFMYGVPMEWYEKYSVRRYGMHGTSHKYMAIRAGELLNKKNPNIISCHLGNGASLAAIKDGKCVNTSMGLTPLAGIIMGTRSGDIDPSIIEYMCNKTGKSVQEITNSLNKESGILGLSGISSDFRELRTAAEEGNETAQFVIDIYCKRVADYVVMYQNELDNKVDALVFTAGIGENAGIIREGVMKAVKTMKFVVDKKVNDPFSPAEHLVLTTPESEVKALMIRTNEEMMIAKDLVELGKL